MADNDTEPLVKLTDFGYPGDSTPDTNSAHGIGDRDNYLKADPDHQSVALTQAMRQHLFGVTGKSTGQPFQWGGKTYWDEDTAPESDYRIDRYNPTHPPDKLTLRTGHEHQAVPTSVLTLRTGYEGPYYYQPEAYTETPAGYSEPEETQQRRVGKEDDSILAPGKMLETIRKQYPQYGKIDDQRLWDQFKAKYPTPLKQLRAAYPQYKKVPDNKFLQAIREKYFPNYSEGDFADLINPPSGFDYAHRVMSEQLPAIVPGLYKGLAELSKYPSREWTVIDDVAKALGINLKPSEALGRAGIVGAALSAPFITDPATAQRMVEWGQLQAAQAEKMEKALPEPKGLLGQIARKGAEGLGGAPAVAPAFLPGPAGLVFGMLYDGVQGYGRAREQGMDNAFMFGAEGMGYRALQQWLLYTPRGRMLSALYWGAAGVADQEVKEFLADPQGMMQKAFTGNTLVDLVSTAAVNAFFGGLASLGADKFKAAPRKAYEAARQARQSGDYKEAGRLLDRTMLLLPEPVQKAATNNLLSWRNEAIEARPGDNPLEMPGQRGFLMLKDAPRPEPEPEPELPQHVQEYNQALDKLEEVMVAQAQKREQTPAEPDQASATHYGPDGFTDQYYYSGIDLGKAYDELAKVLKPVRELFVPEHETPHREAAGAIIGEQIGVMQRRNQQMKTAWYRKQQLEDWMKFAYETDQRRAFWDGVPKATRMKWFELYEAGRSTGNPIADRMFQMHGAFVKKLADLDQARGFIYNLRDSYIYHALEKPEDVDRLAAELRTRGWANPDFMHAREIPTVEMLHAMGFKLKTYNLEDLDQMRLEASNRAEMRAATLENMAAAKWFNGGLAVSTDEMAMMEKFTPKTAAELRMQMGKLPWRSPRAPHTEYWLHKEADQMLHLAADPVDWHPVAGAMVNSALAIKQRTVGLNLAWSLYHQVHMLSIGAADSVALAYSKSLAHTADWGDWARAVEDVVTLGGASQVRALKYNQKLLNWYLAEGENKLLGFRTGKGHSDITLEDLSPYEQKVFELQKGGGFVPLVSHERQIQIGKMLLANRVGKEADKALDFAYSVATARPYQKWLFSRVIPSLKMYSYDRAALALLEARPELNRPQYLMQRNIELRKIRDQVDARYGEQNMRQIFADPHMKAYGQAFLLSYSWLKSFIDVYGGGVHDMTRFLKDKPETPQATNRIAYLFTLNAMTMLKNAAIATFLGAGVLSLKDLIYPNIGYDKTGKKLNRVKPPEWLTTEVGGIVHHVYKEGPILGLGRFFANKMQPALSTLFDVFANKDYYGADISPRWDPKKDLWTNFMEQVWTKAEFSLRQGTSFTFQAALKPGSEPKDVLLQMLGIPVAPQYAMRSELENRIVDDYIQYDLPAAKTRGVEDQIAARRDYRTAVQSGDKAAQDAAAAKMKALGITDKSIKGIEKTANETEAQRLFSQMESGKNKDNPEPGEQLYYWRQMSPEEKEEFRKYLHKDLRNEP